MTLRILVDYTGNDGEDVLYFAVQNLCGPNYKITPKLYLETRVVRREWSNGLVQWDTPRDAKAIWIAKTPALELWLLANAPQDSTILKP